MDNTRRPVFNTIRTEAKEGIITEAALRRLVKRGECPGFYSGRTFYVNHNALVDWLNEQSAGTSREGVRPNA